MIAQYAEGKSSNGNAGAYFRKGVELVYPTTPLTDAELDTVYGRVRCVMYHNGYTKAGVGVTGGQAQAIAMHSGDVILDPEKLTNDLNAHFAGYIAHLKNAAHVKERANLETIFDKGTMP